MGDAIGHSLLWHWLKLFGAASLKHVLCHPLPFCLCQHEFRIPLSALRLALLELLWVLGPERIAELEALNGLCKCIRSIISTLLGVCLMVRAVDGVTFYEVSELAN